VEQSTSSVSFLYANTTKLKANGIAQPNKLPPQSSQKTFARGRLFCFFFGEAKKKEEKATTNNAATPS
jgi:hypothetical protein